MTTDGAQNRLWSSFVRWWCEKYGTKLGLVMCVCGHVITLQAEQYTIFVPLLPYICKPVALWPESGHCPLLSADCPLDFLGLFPVIFHWTVWLDSPME